VSGHMAPGRQRIEVDVSRKCECKQASELMFSLPSKTLKHKVTLRAAPGESRPFIR
jgi:hypothetical protein